MREDCLAERIAISKLKQLEKEGETQRQAFFDNEFAESHKQITQINK